jgi:hypothetical protein
MDPLAITRRDLFLVCAIVWLVSRRMSSVTLLVSSVYGVSVQNNVHRCCPPHGRERTGLRADYLLANALRKDRAALADLMPR